MLFEATILCASGDGVGASVLFAAPNASAQYLFNVPEGFSRLALEHKIRPSAKLACVFLSSIRPDAAGGIGGLVLRLAQDGHGQMQLVGPSGTAAYVHALRHIFHWRHPKVYASECNANQATPVFEDDHVVIIPLIAGDESVCCPWCARGLRENIKDLGVEASENGRKNRGRRREIDRDFKWIITNSKHELLPELEEGVNPVYRKDQQGGVSSVGLEDGSGTSGTLLGYLCYIKVLNTGVALLDVEDSAALNNLQVHPAFRCPLHLPQGLAAVIHLSERSTKQKLQEKYPGIYHLQVTGGGFHTPLETMAKLNLAHDRLFPLPRYDEDLQRRYGTCTLLSKVVVERSASGFCVRLDHSSCVNPFNFKEFQDEFLKSRPEVKEQLLSKNAQATNIASTPNQLAAALVKTNLVKRKEKPQDPPNLASIEAAVVF